MTNVGTAHLAMYDGPEAIIAAKGELVRALPRTGVAVLNADDDACAALTAITAARVLRCRVAAGAAVGPDADVWADAVTLDDALRPSFRLHTPWGDGDARVAARGRHQVANAVAAAAAALASGSSLEHVLTGLATGSLSPWRMDVTVATSGAIIINDSYNANPGSMAAALHALSELRADRRIAVLGTMAELGDAGPVEHLRITALARSLGIDVVIAVAEPAYGAVTVDGSASALDMLSALRIGDGDAVLVKGSRVAGLESLAATLVGADRR